MVCRSLILTPDFCPKTGDLSDFRIQKLEHCTAQCCAGQFSIRF